VYIGRKYRVQVRAIGWLLIAALFALTVRPMHVHLQHIDHASSLTHEHAIDLHFTVDEFTPADHEHAAVFPATPDVMLKKFSDNPLLAAILVYLSILLLSVAFANRQPPTIRFIQPKPGWFLVAPPLRAPPRL
jgi:hypothetical protein